MAKRIVAGLGVVLCLALLALWRFGLVGGLPSAKAEVQAQPAPPGVPVTAGVVVAQDVPKLLHGIGTVQALSLIHI